MLRKNVTGIGWFPILLVLFLSFSAYVPGGMGMAENAYSSMVSVSGQADRQAPGNASNASNRDSTSQGRAASAQIADFLQEEMVSQFLPAQEPHLLSLYPTAYHAVHRLIYKKPLSELALRTGGHAPP